MKSDTENPETPRSQGWSSWMISHKAQVIGAMTGLLTSIAFMIISSLPDGHHGHPNLPSSIDYLATLPTMILWNIHSFSSWVGKQSASIQTAVFRILALGFYTVLGWFVGLVVGWFLSRKTKATK
jgi:hypothetical protein